jgi:2-polyprenyl-3-methyl-5-hydroxy-6-metoxy-1,4-benzoquinol methylase
MLSILIENMEYYLFGYLGKELARFPEVRVLDVGCGGQPLRNKLEAKGYRYFGLDVIQQKSISLDFLCEIDKPLPEELMKHDKFQLIICTEVLEHVADWNQTFCNLSSLLVPGGFMFVTTPHMYILHEEPFDFWRPTLYAIEHFSKSHNLELVIQEKSGTGRDVMSMILGLSYFSRPKRSIKANFIVGLAKVCKWCLLKIINNEDNREVIAAYSPYYLSNIVIARKIACNNTL